MAATEVFLVDNGSLQPAAIRQLRRLAADLARKTGCTVAPVSVLHSSAVPAGRLGGRKAEIFEPAVRRRAEKGARDFVVVPLFVGRSRALTDYIPSCARRLRRECPGLRVRVARPVEQSSGNRLARLLADHVRRKLTRTFLRGERAKVAVVDHGSPARAVAAARNRVASGLRALLGDEVEKVAACSMERRPGRAYAFNEPLLEDLLASLPWNSGPVVVAQLFFLPGRHAGPTGDIAAICTRARKRHRGLRTVRTALLGRHPGVVAILADRLRSMALVK